MSQQDMQDLLRLMTTNRNKISMLAAMQRVKALQAHGLKSVSTIAEASLTTLQLAITDEKAAKALQSACRAYMKDSSKKRPLSETISPPAKRHQSIFSFATPLTPSELEASLALPLPATDEEAISQTVLLTNRAPLVLIFAVQLLKYTMPEQPLSSRLSLGQAVCSANSRSKAVSLGLTRGKSAIEEETGWGRGQPRVRIMGREVAVLKRGGYLLDDDEQKDPEDSGIKRTENETKVKTEQEEITARAIETDFPGASHLGHQPPAQVWSTSKQLSLKSSTFVASIHPISSPHQLSHLLSTLPPYTSICSLPTHTITAYRIPTSSHNITKEHSDDDGESRGGAFLLDILRENNITNILLVIRRWYGGVMLGTDRWRLMGDCAREVLSSRLQARSQGAIEEAVWGIDEEATSAVSGQEVGIPLHKPDSARAYILKAFASFPSSSPLDASREGKAKSQGKQKQTANALQLDREENLGLLMGGLDLLFASWAPYISKDDLDRRAWSWYVDVRPEVEAGAKGWGGKGEVRLKRLLELRRKG